MIMVETATYKNIYRHNLVNFLDLMGLVGYFTSIILGIFFHLEFLLTVNLGIAFMVACFVLSTLLCYFWKISRSLEW
jgi:hypothetical protein